ncbi:MAG TPA: tripartite tricarboxylate transporter substrate binding protein [Burkholderiaceae bacterium]|nr:tripartite tricarboxylate transporter substrate binding protein [Burkholderiaceae bacterium]
MIRTIKRGVATLAAASLLSAAGAALAENSYPSKPIQFVVPFAPGGTTSILARALADRLGPVLGQSVVVMNRPGAGGNIGAEIVARAEPDGYTMLMGPIGLAINPALYPKLSYDPLKDLAPVTLYGGVPNLLVVHPDVPAKSVVELIEHARANPGKLSFASNGNGTSSHLAAEMLKSAAKLDIVHVPYKGGAPAMQDLIAGQVSMLFDQMPAVMPQVTSNRVRALGVSSAKRSGAAPSIPTLAESGVPDFDMTVWFGLLVPAGTPPEIVDRLNRSVRQVLDDEGFHAWLSERGVDTMHGSPEAFGEFLRSETERWGRIVRESGARIE